MTRSRKGVVSLIGLMTVLFFVLLLSTAFVEEKKNAINNEEEKNASDISAMKVGKDPDGGLRRPTPAEEKKLNAEMQKTLAKYPKHNAKQKADGSISLVVAPHAFNAMVAHKAADGTIHLNCTDQDGHAAATPQMKDEMPEE